MPANAPKTATGTESATGIGLVVPAEGLGAHTLGQSVFGISTAQVAGPTARFQCAFKRSVC